jgi:hypothetical protein
MKTLNISFTDAEFKKLVKARLDLEMKHGSRYSWYKFLLWSVLNAKH